MIMDTGLFTGHQRMSDAWRAFRDFVERTEDLPIGFLVQGGAHTELPDEVVAAYDAPFPYAGREGRGAGVPADDPDDARRAGRRRGQPRARGAARPTSGRCCCCGPTATRSCRWRPASAFAAAIGREPPRIIEGAGHFLQEDRGEEIGRLIAEWLTR